MFVSSSSEMGLQSLFKRRTIEPSFDCNIASKEYFDISTDKQPDGGFSSNTNITNEGILVESTVKEPPQKLSCPFCVNGWVDNANLMCDSCFNETNDFEDNYGLRDSKCWKEETSWDDQNYSIKGF